MSALLLPWTAPPITQNGLRRMHHHAEAKAKREAKETVQHAIRSQGTPPMAGAIVILHWQMPNKRRRDGDGAAPTLKVILDALVTEGVLTDDSWVEVPHSGITTHPPIKGSPGRIWVSLSDPLGTVRPLTPYGFTTPPCLEPGSWKIFSRDGARHMIARQPETRHLLTRTRYSYADDASEWIEVVE